MHGVPALQPLYGGPVRRWLMRLDTVPSILLAAFITWILGWRRRWPDG